MLINDKNLIKTIKRVDLTNEQETNLNEMPEIKKNINDIKSVIGDSNSGLVKDVADLKANLNTVGTILDSINGEVI